MNNQLMAKLRSRQIASGVQEEQHTKPTVHKTEIQKPSDFSQKRKNLQAFFAKQGGGSSVQEVPIKKQEIKGNTQGFNNARKLLQQNGLGGGIGGSSLPPPPPPSLNGLPPPPPPPPGNLPPPPPPPSGILPPPPIPSGNLPPPPPPLSGNILPPPPSLSGNIPPPPPPKNFSSPSNKSYNSPSRSSNHPQQHPKPQQNNIAQSSSQKVHERPPPPPPPSREEHVTHQRVSQKVSQPPQHNLPPPPNNSIDNPYSNNSSTHGNSHLKVPKQEPRISQKGQKKVKHPRTPIFSGNNTKQNITGQFFGKDLAGLVKRQFIRNSQILPIITSKVEKKVYNFNFPSIQNHIREVEPIETLYADNLDVVSCYLQKNLNAIKPHQQSRRNLINGLKTYDWSKDSLKIKQIQQIPHSVQSIKYEEPNLVQIKNCLNRCDTLINIYKKHENYEACAEIKKTKEQLDKLISRYCKEPQGNQAILDRIDTIVQKIKTANI